MKQYRFQALTPGKSHFSASEITGNKVCLVQFTIETTRGKNVDVKVDYDGKAVLSLNKFIQIVHAEFTERTIMDLQ